jgi:hypothetical protein
VALAAGASGACPCAARELTVTTRTTPTPAAPDLPFALTSLYDHLDRDTEGYAAKVFALAVQAWSEESGYGLRLWQDWIQAYSQLVLAPYSALAQLSFAPTITSGPGRSQTPKDEHPGTTQSSARSRASP